MGRQQPMPCPLEPRHHEPGRPSGYLAFDSWASDLSKTHRQTKCPGCGLWKVWVPLKSERAHR